MSSISADDFDFTAAATCIANVDHLLNDYFPKGSSSRFSMASLRTNFAHIVPFSDPHFLKHFSPVAGQAIKDDSQNSRLLFHHWKTDHTQSILPNSGALRFLSTG